MSDVLKRLEPVRHAHADPLDERGRAGLQANRREIARVIWKRNSRAWPFDDMLAAQPPITAPAITLDGLADGNFPATPSLRSPRTRSRTPCWKWPTSAPRFERERIATNAAQADPQSPDPARLTAQGAGPAPRGELMSPIEFALLQFDDVTAAEEAFADARSRSARDAPWIRQVGLVEHHHNGHWVLRGTFAGHYLDVDEALHVSERGSVEGFAAGAALGALLGPPGLAAGMVLGAMIGSQTAQPTEHDHEPRLLSEQLRARLPHSGSAIALITETSDVDDMLSAIGEIHGNITRVSLTAAEIGSLETSLRSTPLASPGPSTQGEEASEVSTETAPSEQHRCPSAASPSHAPTVGDNPPREWPGRSPGRHDRRR